jgi:hypothetical protein
LQLTATPTHPLGHVGTNQIHFDLILPGSDSGGGFPERQINGLLSALFDLISDFFPVEVPRIEGDVGEIGF